MLGLRSAVRRDGPQYLLCDLAFSLQQNDAASSEEDPLFCAYIPTLDPALAIADVEL